VRDGGRLALGLDELLAGRGGRHHDVEPARFAGEALPDGRSKLNATERLIADDQETAHSMLLPGAACRPPEEGSVGDRTPVSRRVNMYR
jgi:hypothetical protein